MTILKSFEDEMGIMSFAHIKKYNADPLDVTDQFRNGAKHMFSSISDTANIPDANEKLKHISGMVIYKDGETTGEFIGSYDMALFDQRINNLNERCNLDTYEVEPKDLKIGDVIIDMTNYSVQTFNG